LISRETSKSSTSESESSEGDFIREGAFTNSFFCGVTFFFGVLFFFGVFFFLGVLFFGAVETRTNTIKEGIYYKRYGIKNILFSTTLWLSTGKLPLRIIPVVNR